MLKKAYQTRTKRPLHLDCVMTPPAIAERIVNHFRPRGKCLEPCRGSAGFLPFLPKSAEWDELAEGKDFFDRSGNFNWIITNPPWSKLSAFLAHSFRLARNVVFLIHIQQAFMCNRLRMAKFYGYGIKEIILLDTPKNFPQGGFQVGVIHWKKNYIGRIKMTDMQRKTYQPKKGKRLRRNRQFFFEA